MDKNQKYSAIVIGVSAGGLQALSGLLTGLPASFDIPVIIVQHRAKDNQELLEELLHGKCIIKIKQADEKEKISAGTVYIAPPNYHLLVERDTTFSLSINEHTGYNKPSIDILFETAAEVFADKLVGIILTGSNNDGSAGIRALKKAGSLTIAQDPCEAQYPQMPNAAIETGAVDFILPLYKIQQFLINLS